MALTEARKLNVLFGDEFVAVLRYTENLKLGVRILKLSETFPEWLEGCSK